MRDYDDDMSLDVSIRSARAEDERELLALHRAVWSPVSEAAPIRQADGTVFDERHPAGSFLIAEHGPKIVGYITQGPPTPLESNRHVRQIQGLGVHASARGQGIGQALVEAACATAQAQGARRMTLRVLGRNLSAQQLYLRCGFTVVGILPEEFFLDGAYVDDIWMSRRLSAHEPPEQ
jgi:ribosomal protein S18 acetylase RimI-like enzyme